VGPGHDLPADDRLVVRFEGKPAKVVVRTDPVTKGQVGVQELDPPPGRKALSTGGLIGEEIFISFDGDADMIKTLLLTIDADGRPARNEKRTIHAGEKLPVTITLGQ
jgi:hypothetical protein